MEKVKKYTKIVVGFVAQTYELKDVSNPTDAGSSELYVCTEQEFIEVIGEPIARKVGKVIVDIDTSKETNQRFGMKATGHGDFIDDRWSITDVQDRYKDVDDEDDDKKEPIPDDVARRILHLCMDKMDANEGINWGVIDYWTDEVLNPESRVNQ